MNQNLKRVIIIGAGAVGGSIAGLLATSGYPIELVARGEHGKKIRAEGLTVRQPNRTTTSQLKCYEQIKDIQWRDDDVTIVATKLNDACNIYDQLLEQAGPTLPVICASNGIQGEAWATERFQTVLSMMIWMPSTHLCPGDVRLFSGDCPGVLDLGPIKGDEELVLSNSLTNWLRKASFDSVSRPDIKRWKYAKWITNLGNAAQALVVDDWKSVAEAARAEGELVLDAYKTDRISTDELLKRTAHIQLRQIGEEARLGGSTWQSRQRGTPLESCWIEGQMADLADEVGVPAPINRFLTSISENPRDVFARELLG